MYLAKSVNEYVDNHPQWSAELINLRSIIQKTDLEEKVKWGMPVYTLKNKNVVGISGFKNHFGIWFFQGVFINDTHNLLINAQEGKTKGQRQMRFTKMDDMDEAIILSYIEQAIQNQKDGKEIKVDRNKELVIPSLLQDAFKQDKALMEAFKNFSLSRKREFTEYIDSAKREETKLNRMNKIVPMIISGVGLNDKYRKS